MTKSGLRTIDGTPVPLVSVHVAGEVAAGHARVTVRQRYRNAESRNVEATYVFPVPSDASLSGFAMTCQGRRLDAVVMARDEAFKAYDEALLQGHGAALLDAERGNVFTASVGNLLPDEDVEIEVEYLQRLHARDGVLRVMIPTLVAPRYVPGKPDDTRRTADGWADPTDRVPDADRITPHVGSAPYRLSLDLAFRLGSEVVVESPSHAIVATAGGAPEAAGDAGSVRVRLASDDEPLDRDLVLLARRVSDGPITTVECHRSGDGEGTVAIAVVPDLFRPDRVAPPLRVTFVVDRSGSMAGASLPQAQAALAGCLRHLREGDAFNLVAFDTETIAFAEHLVPCGPVSLRDADAWIAALEPRGGTAMLEPLRDAVGETPDGLVVLITDGQVANEDEILRAVMAARGSARTRVLAFGIGTNVSDQLLRDLARRTGGGLELIYPGERIDEKVVAQFARATAARVEDLTVSLDGIDLRDVAPAEHGPLVDGEPWVLLGRYATPGRGVVTLRGSLDGEPFGLEIPVALEREAVRPALPKLWATERVRDLLASETGTRRRDAARQRVEEICVREGIASAHASFVVIETREGTRRALTSPSARAIPVSAPAGWAMFGGAPLAAARVASPVNPYEAAWKTTADTNREIDLRDLKLQPTVEETDEALVERIMSRQCASGLFDNSAWPHVEAALDAGRVALLETYLFLDTIELLEALVELGVTASHPVHGRQIEKAVDALLPLCDRMQHEFSRHVGHALALAWLLTFPGRRAELVMARIESMDCAAELRRRVPDAARVREWLRL